MPSKNLGWQNAHPYSIILKGRCKVEFLLIGEAKLKIIMTEEESVHYKLNSLGTECNTAEGRRAFWQVLDMAKSEVGFDPAGDKVLIQFYPVKTGGCEVFVTKLGILPGNSARLVSKSDKVSMLSRKKSYYSFEGLSELVGAISALKRALGSFKPRADVYGSENGKYYLSIEEYGKGGESLEFPSILEFGKSIGADLQLYVNEHFDKLTDGDALLMFDVKPKPDGLSDRNEC
jgi:negative regulator of genetic competence, sporulation and motility